MINLIFSSIQQALENQLNYARNYLGDILDSCVDRVIYLDSDVVVVDDIVKLWEIGRASCRERVPADEEQGVLRVLFRSTFPSLNFKVYIFREDTMINLISSSI